MIALVILTLFNGQSEAATKVPITFIEALAPRDSTSSEKFKKDFEDAIQLGRDLLQKKLLTCGFELETKTAFYDAGDPLQAKELAAAAQKAGAWLLVGPRRSNHYIALVRGAELVPSVSLMAGATEIKDLGPLHTTVSPLNLQLAKIAAKEALNRVRKGAGYVSIVSGDCLTCLDFANYFDQEASVIGLKGLERITVTGENPDVAELQKRVKALNPKFILLPNYSKTSIHVMNGLENEFSGIYVGADGWGDSQFGYVQKGAKTNAIQGFTVRGFPPVKVGLEGFQVGRRVLKQSAAAAPTGGPALAVLKILDVTGELLCGNKTKSAADFSKSFQKASKKFHAPWGVSIYNLKNGEISFAKGYPLKD